MKNEKSKSKAHFIKRVLIKIFKPYKNNDYNPLTVLDKHCIEHSFTRQES